MLLLLLLFLLFFVIFCVCVNCNFFSILGCIFVVSSNRVLVMCILKIYKVLEYVYLRYIVLIFLFIL